MFNKSLTIVLPVHNGESRLRKNVGELLELASELTSKFGVLIIDDGSTDSTFEVAEELAAHYPQVSVRRNRQYRGLGDSIEFAQRKVRSDAVILHDGVTPIDSLQLRRLWDSWANQSPSGSNRGSLARLEWDADLEFSNVAAVQRSMEKAHKRTSGFQLIAQIVDRHDSAAIEIEAKRSATLRMTRPDAPSKGDGIGSIPALPRRPKFLTAIADFALGE